MSNYLRRIALLITVVAFLASTALWWMSKIEAKNLASNRFDLIGYSSVKSDVSAMQKIAEEKNAAFEVKKIDRFEKKKIGYEVTFSIEDKNTMEKIIKVLSSSKIKAKLVKNQEAPGYYIQVNGIYAKKEKAQKTSDFLYRKIMTRFAVVDAYKRTAVISNAFTVKNLSKEDAESMQKLFNGIKIPETEIVPTNPPAK